MSHIDKTVFISYRRTNQFTALAIFQSLTARGYDVFFDYNSIKSGDFEQIILSEIEARGHFLIVLTPSVLERCSDPKDSVRREIEHALKQGRNIIPLTFDGFDFKDMDSYLVGDLNRLKNYNVLRVPIDYFDAAMDRLCNDFLNIPIDAVLHPALTQNQVEVQQTIEKAKAEPKPTQDAMTAEEYYECGYEAWKNSDYNDALEYAEKAIMYSPSFPDGYVLRGLVKARTKDYDGAIVDYTKALKFRSDYARVLYNRGAVYYYKGQIDHAITDYDEAIRLKPDFTEAYNNRGAAYHDIGQVDHAIADYSEAIRLEPNDASAYRNRGSAYVSKNNYRLAHADFQKYIDLGGVDSDRARGWIEDNKHKL